MSSLYHQIAEKYAQALFLNMKSSNEETKGLLQQRLQHLIRFVKLTREPSPWIGLHEKLLAKEQDAWLSYLAWVYMFSCAFFQEAKALSPFSGQPLYVQREVSDTGIIKRIVIVLDPSKLDGVSVL